MGFLDIFRRREAKASAVGPMLVANNRGQAVWTERNLDQYSREGYQRNPVVFRCVRLIAANAASMPIVAKIGEREIADHPALKVLNRPNPFMSGKAFLEALYAYRMLTGNAFAEVVTVAGKPVELHPHRPERVKVVPGPDGYPEAYEYQVNGQIKRFPVNPATGVSDFLHLKDFHPLSDHYGMSALDPASWAIDAHMYGSREIATTLSRGGVPVGGFFYDGEHNLSDDQIRQSREMFMDRLTQARRDRSPAVLNRFWKWIKFGASPAELGVTELKADAAREICFALGVPPMLLGIPGDNTYSNYAEANRAFWRETVIPFAGKNIAEIADWLALVTATPGLTMAPNTDDLPALATERAELWAMLGSAEFITVNEKREAAGYEETEGGDVVLVASSDVPLEDAGTAIHGGTEPMDGADAEDTADAEDDATQGEDNSGDRADSRP